MTLKSLKILYLMARNYYLPIVKYLFCLVIIQIVKSKKCTIYYKIKKKKFTKKI